jgi:hypothetical protein
MTSAVMRNEMKSSDVLAAVFPLLAATWIVAMLWFGSADPQSYRALLQEDQIVEWTTFWLFLAAGVLGLFRSVRRRRLFDGLVALFCIFVAGEEISWGQRLVGYTAPEFFLRANFQQEVNLHNLPHSVQPGWFLMLALAGYGVLLPLLGKGRSSRALVGRIGATAAPLALLPWYATAILLLWWYPLTLTGEWVECLSGALFLASTGAPSTTVWMLLPTTVVLATGTMSVTNALERGRDETRIACARAELRSLADDIIGNDGGLPSLWQIRRVHKRIWSSISEGYIDSDQLVRFHAATCDDPAANATRTRREYGIDPWGSPYWLLVERESAMDRRVTVYSFGPNRRRDLSEAGDDIADTRMTRVSDTQ